MPDLLDQLRDQRAAVRTNQDGILTREQSVYDWLQHRGAFDQQAEPLSFDRYLRGLATAQWDGAEHERALAEATVGAGAPSCRRPSRPGSSTWPATGPWSSEPAPRRSR